MMVWVAMRMVLAGRVHTAKMTWAAHVWQLKLAHRLQVHISLVHNASHGGSWPDTQQGTCCGGCALQLPPRTVLR